MNTVKYCCLPTFRSALFTPGQQAYTFEPKKSSLKNDLEFLERYFCHLKIICTYDQGFCLLKRATYWYFPLN